MSLQLAVRGVLLLLLGLLVVLANWGPTRRRENKPTRKISWAFFLSVGVGLACIGLLYCTDSSEYGTAWFIVGLAVIPACVVFASVFAVSFWEPIVMPWVLYLVPRVFHFMPPPVNREFQPLEYLAVVAVLSLVTSALGCLVLHLSRRFRKGHWSWSLVRGLAWGMPCAVGSMFALRTKVSTDIALSNDYTLVWVVLAEVVLVTAVAGIRRKRPEVKLEMQQGDPTVAMPPTQVVTQDTSSQNEQETTPLGWRAIRNYPDLFPIGRKINYPAGVAFALTAFLGVFLSSVIYLEWSSLGQALPRQLLWGLVHALLGGVLFMSVSSWVRQPWMLPVVWGFVSETADFIAIVLLGASLEWVAGVTPYYVVAAASLMAGLVFAVQAWGPGLGSLITGSVLFAVPVWAYVLIVSMPGRSFIMLLVNRLIFAVLLYLGMRYYFEGLKQRGLKAFSAR